VCAFFFGFLILILSFCQFCGVSEAVVFVFGEISHAGEKKNTLANATKGFLGILKRKSPYLEKKKS
jgi:hypothetical protein